METMGTVQLAAASLCLRFDGTSVVAVGEQIAASTTV